MKREVFPFMAARGSRGSPGRNRFRLALLATLAAVAVSLGLSPVAGAGVSDQTITPKNDPLTTNIPYLAWRGEQVRLVKCFFPDQVMLNTVSDPSAVVGKFLIEDWSGEPHVWPQFENALDGIVPLFLGTGEHSGQWCAAVDIVSLKAGLAVVKLVGLGIQTPTAVLWGGLSIVPTDKHQFLVAWMNLNDPALTELRGGGDPDGNGILFAGNFIDPRHDMMACALVNCHTDGDNLGFIQVRVTGTIPMGNNFAGLFRGDQVTLPAQWPDLANVFAIEGDPDNPENGPGGAAAMRWDIHDDDTDREGHFGNPCPLPALGPPDAVDNCIGNIFNFSTIWGGHSLSPTFGPFDPLRPKETLLSDGKLDWGDAPMPAARVDVAIAPNTPGKKDGVGSLVEVDKMDVYIRNPLLITGAVHNLYAPFYFAWLPATEAPAAEASGIDGPRHGNNFPGFLDGGRLERGYGPYVFWRFADFWETRPSGDTRCLRRFADYKPEFRPLPSGPDRAVVYTDEHGEARVAFLPGLGFYFDNFGVFNANGGCDLQGEEVLGRAFITATAKYPYQPVFDRAHVSDPLEKIVKSRFTKHLGYEPKGPGSDNDVARIVHATAIDIDGTPFAYEKVCFSADKNAESMQTAPGFRAVEDPNGIHRLCTLTNKWGIASIEVFNSNETKVNVIAHFIDEQLLRHIFVDFGRPGSSGGTLPPAPGTSPKDIVPPSGAGAGTSVPTAAQIAQVLGQATAATLVPVKLTWARVKFSKRVGHALAVRIVGGKKAVRVEIRLLGKNGHLMRRVLRWVPTNKKVLVPDLAIPKMARQVRIRVV